MADKRPLYSMFRIAPAGSRIVEIAGQLGRNKDDVLVDGLRAQIVQALANLSSVLRDAGVEDLSQVLKIRVFLVDIAVPSVWDLFNDIYRDWVYLGCSGELPTRAAYDSSDLPIGALLEMEATAYLEDDRPMGPERSIR